MRKEITLTIDRPGRDAGKVFVLKEMSAMRAEKWAMRALLALTRSRIDIDEDTARGGLAAIAVVGIQALSGLQFAEAEPLMDEMLANCVMFVPNPAQPLVKRTLIEDDIEEIVTLARLRAELLALHTGFSLPVSLWTSVTSQVTGGAISNTPTSPAPSAG